MVARCRACSIALAVLVDVNRRLAGQELVVLDGARAGLAAHGALLVRPGAVRHDARGHRPVRSIRGEREGHAVEDGAVASLGPSKMSRRAMFLGLRDTVRKK